MYLINKLSRSNQIDWDELREHGIHVDIDKHELDYLSTKLNITSDIKPRHNSMKRSKSAPSVNTKVNHI